MVKVKIDYDFDDSEQSILSTYSALEECDCLTAIKWVLLSPFNR